VISITLVNCTLFQPETGVTGLPVLLQITGVAPTCDELKVTPKPLRKAVAFVHAEGATAIESKFKTVTVSARSEPGSTRQSIPSKPIEKANFALKFIALLYYPEGALRQEPQRLAGTIVANPAMLKRNDLRTPGGCK